MEVGATHEVQAKTESCFQNWKATLAHTHRPSPLISHISNTRTPPKSTTTTITGKNRRTIPPTPLPSGYTTNTTGLIASMDSMGEGCPVRCKSAKRSRKCERGKRVSKLAPSTVSSLTVPEESSPIPLCVLVQLQHTATSKDHRDKSSSQWSHKEGTGNFSYDSIPMDCLLA